MKNLIYNTVKQKLLDGKKVVGGTIYTPDPDIYLEMANSGFDFLWMGRFECTFELGSWEHSSALINANPN